MLCVCAVGSGFFGFGYFSEYFSTPFLSVLVSSPVFSGVQNEKILFSMSVLCGRRLSPGPVWPLGLIVQPVSMICKNVAWGPWQAPRELLQCRDLVVWIKFMPFVEDCAPYTNRPIMILALVEKNYGAIGHRVPLGPEALCVSWILVHLPDLKVRWTQEQCIFQ